MNGSIVRFGGALLLGAGALSAGGCSSTSSGSESGGSTLRNIVMYGSTTVPPAAPPEADDVYCPSVEILDGGAAIRAYAGSPSDPNALRHQISFGQLARECSGRPDGAILVKVGVEGRALLGPAGSPGRFDAPVTFVIKRGDRVVATRVQRIAVVIPAGDSQGGFTAIEEGLVVPPGTGTFEIAIGLGGSAPRERPQGRRRG